MHPQTVIGMETKPQRREKYKQKLRGAGRVKKERKKECESK